MFDAYAFIRAQVEQLTALAFPGAVTKRNLIRCPAAGCEASTSFALFSGSDPQAVLKAFETQLKETPPLFCGTPVFRRVFERKGHICFELTTEMYDCFVQSASGLEAAPLCGTGLDRTEYALNRMLMLAHTSKFYGEHASCPDDPRVRRALWLCFGIVERLKSPRLLKLRINDAAQALLTMSHHLPPAQRPALLRRCGGVADCASRLLHLGLKSINNSL